jgi:signal transduction histidine kinase
MKLNSLSARLFAAAAVWALVVLPITAFVLISVYRGAVERNFDARLNVYLTDLVADLAAARTDPAAKPPSLTDPLFTRPFSSWYWQITPLGDGKESFLASDSLLDQRLPIPSQSGVVADQNQIRRAYIAGPEQQRLRILEREITIDQAGNAVSRFSFAVSGAAAEIDQTIGEFRTLLVVALTILGVGLVLVTYFQVQYGLRPLRAIGTGLAAIRSGDAEQLEGELPTEIVPLQSELNALIQSNRAIVDRARTHVGNLAHALKTPLSVITNEAAGNDTSFARKVSDQAQLMRDQVAHHLNRASMAARSGVIGSQTEVEPVVSALVRALQRIYQERNLVVDITCPHGTMFRGEKHDLEEMIGNLLDNACKWANHSIEIKVKPQKKTGNSASENIVITVNDDGPGLPEKQRESATQRGRKLDETKPGSGLGLSIVADLVCLYKGTLTLEESASGGLRVQLQLPGS